MVNHQSNTNNMREISVGLESVVLGELRTGNDDVGGLRANDLLTEVTKSVAEKQAETDRVIVVSYNFYDVNGDIKDFEETIENNDIVYSIQYKVELYGKGSFEEDGKTLKPGATPQSSTENHITLKRNN